MSDVARRGERREYDRLFPLTPPPLYLLIVRYLFWFMASRGAIGPKGRQVFAVKWLVGFAIFNSVYKLMSAALRAKHDLCDYMMLYVHTATLDVNLEPNVYNITNIHLMHNDNNTHGIEL